MSNILDDLNAQQRQAVTADGQHVLVLAGPGSGKTRVLTYRMAYLVKELGVRPYEILAVTFTNKAAREMESRVQKLLETKLGTNLEGVWVGTFHGVCARILRREHSFLPFTSSYVIFDEDDQLAVVKHAMKDLNVDDKLYKPTSILGAISTAKNNLQLPEEYAIHSYRDEVISRVYKRYQELLQTSNGLDFDDLLMRTVLLFEQNPQVTERYARRFSHILVDEFQDTNLAQYQLLRQLASLNSNHLFVVGDEDQSIYRWRGADYRNVLRFEEDYPTAQRVLLEQNYRSTQVVLDAARAVIDRNANRTVKRLFTERDGGQKITLYTAGDDRAEAAYVVDTIRRLTLTGKTKGGEYAVMYRTNAMSRLLEEAFLHTGMAYRLVGAQRFYGRREVKDLIAYLRLVFNPQDEVSLNRVINVPPRGIGDKTAVGLQLAARQGMTSPGGVLLDLGNNGENSPYWKQFSGRGALVLADFGALLTVWREEMPKITLPALFDRILAETRYQEYVDDGTDEGSDRWANVQELRKLAYEYADRGMEAFLENLALVSDQDTLPEHTSVPTLLTLHAAKGLEFPQVFIVGLDEGLLPHSRSLDDPEEMAEERRLLYVGITRAKDKVYLVRAQQRSTYGSFEETIASRFLGDIPEELLQLDGIRSYGSRAPSRREQYSRWEGTRLAPPSVFKSSGGKRSAPEVEPKYHTNMRVRHPVWGEGVVIHSKILDGEETLDAFFESVGFKRLVASLANLEILGE
jgi:DNA helicase-2/ATP-dependent DNA helicase PcrA